MLENRNRETIEAEKEVRNERYDFKRRSDVHVSAEEWFGESVKNVKGGTWKMILRASTRYFNKEDKAR